MKNFGKPPKSLSPEAKAWWNKLVTEFEFVTVDQYLKLAAAMHAYDRWIHASTQIAADGLVLSDRFEQKKLHPLVLVERDSRAAMLAALRDLNLDVDPTRGDA